MFAYNMNINKWPCIGLFTMNKFNLSHFLFPSLSSSLSFSSSHCSKEPADDSSRAISRAFNEQFKRHQIGTFIYMCVCCILFFIIYIYIYIIYK